MEPYVMFIEHQDRTGQWHKSGPLLLNSKTEKQASNAAIAKADELYPAQARSVLVVSGDSKGRPIAEIRRPRLD